MSAYITKRGGLVKPIDYHEDSTSVDVGSELPRESRTDLPIVMNLS
jgi:hypothetical protein